MNKPTRGTVGVYLKPHTRDRLNKFVADTRLATGRFISQSAAVDMLLDEHEALMRSVASQQPQRVPEYA